MAGVSNPLTPNLKHDTVADREVFQASGSASVIGFIARGGTGDWIGSIDNLKVGRESCENLKK